MPKTPTMLKLDEDGLVGVKITKFGSEKGVSTGEHIGAQGDVMAARGDVLRVDEGTARALEAKGYGEIVE